jgi:hypothetical protein
MNWLPSTADKCTLGCVMSMMRQPWPSWPAPMAAATVSAPAVIRNTLMS